MSQLCPCNLNSDTVVTVHVGAMQPSADRDDDDEWLRSLLTTPVETADPHDDPGAWLEELLRHGREATVGA